MIMMVIIGVLVLAVVGVFTFSLEHVAQKPGKQDLAQPDDRGKR